MQNNTIIPPVEIKAIVGLGNPGPAYSTTRHNIGFLVVDALADQNYGSWQTKQNMELCSINLGDHKIVLVKPMTYMNNSGEVLGYLKKQGITQENILVIHDELELPFGILKFRFDGSAKGHNGLKSIMAHGGSNFLRLRFGIDRPTNREDVPDYVLAKFRESSDTIAEKIEQACKFVTNFIQK
ncbi:aminoacyl-tRNA hydrolase [Candidatus Babeliales bacterium]|nr:aminoacyl-tRNA hydrolase [Candidatus Babeliales bacterium]MBP9843426.1 aminoacyl-tRNA hydrolase [Candidatus Babeliales bacterium]